MADHSPAALTDLVTPVVIRVAATIGLLQAVVDTPAAPGALATRLNVEEDVVRRLGRFLRVRGVLTADEDGTLRATSTCRAVLEHAGARLDWQGAAGWLDRLFVAGCLPAVRGEQVGSDVWATLDSDPDLSRSFDELMGARAEEWSGPLLTHPVWRTTRRVADLGGGHGHLLFRLLRLWPHLQGTLVERAGPARVAAAESVRQQVSDRVQVVVADIRRAVPAGCDAYLLAHVLHDWDDADALRILRSAATAAGRRGRIIVVERELAPQEHPGQYAQLEASSQDLRMFVLFGGRERTHAEFRALAARAGLALGERHPLEGGRTMLVFEAGEGA